MRHHHAFDDVTQPLVQTQDTSVPTDDRCDVWVVCSMQDKSSQVAGRTMTKVVPMQVSETEFATSLAMP